MPPDFPALDEEKIPHLSPDVIAVAVRLQRLKADGFCGSVEVNFNREAQIRDLRITSREQIRELLNEISVDLAPYCHSTKV